MMEKVFDVIIVGGGGSGLAAAVSAGESCRVLVLEKAPTIGGTTALSVGSITASQSRLQKKLGVVDSPDEHLEDYGTYAGQNLHLDNPELAKLLTQNVGDTVNWLSDLGVEFFGPVQEPPHRKPRMHNVLPTSRSYIYHLHKKAKSAGVVIRTGTAVIELVTKAGHVCGIIAQDATGTKIHYKARRGVILAGGDFSNNNEFRRDNFGDITTTYEAANVFATGDCQELALKLGAKLCNAKQFEGPQMRFPPAPKQSLLLKLPPYRIFAKTMRWTLDHLPGWIIRPFAMGIVTTYLAPDPRLFSSGALIINSEGERQDRLESGPQQESSKLYVIFDRDIYKKFCAYPFYIATAPNVAFAYAYDFKRNRKDVFKQADTVEELAGQIGVSSCTLNEAIVAQNSHSNADTLKIATPPFVALGPVLPYILTTHGGLAVSNNLEVLGPDDQPISGLFAVGSAGRGGLLLPGHGHSLGWAFTSGRLAGKIVAQREPLDQI